MYVAMFEKRVIWAKFDS